MPQSCARSAASMLLLSGLLAVSPPLASGVFATDRSGTELGREERCLALIAFAEAASEGPEGMAAVIRVVRNRMKHGAFPSDACAVVAQAGQFQPVDEWPALRQAIREPDKHDLAQVLGATSRHGRKVLEAAQRLARAGGTGRDPTGGALYFVNPLFMDPGKCPWFAGLKRTARIGGHVFMTHYGPRESRGEPALDCDRAGPGVVVRRGSRLTKEQAVGLFHPEGPRTTSRTVTPAMLKAWKRTGKLAQRQAVLKNLFRPGWYRLE
ncbi:MAG TPA: cell wall hydrolase [Geminicoccaceae bacterium]|nr:cell wall hydrolase [Geminicoccaceae bacterium]